MNKIKFILKRIKSMDFKAMLAVAGKISKKTKKLRLFLLVDIIVCGLKYGAGYKDYELYEFYNLTNTQRATYVVRTTSNLIIRHCNDRNYYHCLNDKIEFNTVYNDFLKRDWLDFRSCSREDFKKFIENKKSVIVKPVDGCCGVGVYKLDIDETKSYDELYDELKNTEGSDLLEEYIIQHQDMAKLYPNSVNTCRVTTLLKNNEVVIVFASLKIGNNGKVVDNINNGGMFSPIDIETGTILQKACDKDGKAYDKHPITNAAIVGFKIPYWTEVMEACKKAALVTPQVRYCGWDVAVTDNGPIFVEGNNLPDYSFMQLPQHTPDKIGMLPRYRELLGDEMNI